MDDETLERNHRLAKVMAVVVLILFGSLLTWRFLNVKEKPGRPFSLTQRNRTWNFSDDAKFLNLVYFGYTKCTDECPKTLSYIGRALTSIDSETAEQVRAIFISVDEEHDTPEATMVYARQFFPAFVALTGTKAEVSEVGSLYGVSYSVSANPKSYFGYTVAHPDYIFVLDKRARLIDLLPAPKSPNEIIKVIKANL